MTISIIAAMTPQHLIGINNQLPWHLPADLQRFKALTLGKPVIMGRKTFESIGRPLSERTNIIITRNVHYKKAHCQIVHSLQQAIAAAGHVSEIMIIGGAEIFQQALPLAERMYLTYVSNVKLDGDTFFPRWNSEEWQEVYREEHHPDENNKYPFTFVTLERISEV